MDGIDEELLTIDQAAKIARLCGQTLRNHIREDLLPSVAGADGQRLIQRSTFYHTKFLRISDAISAHGVARSDLELARRSGRIVVTRGRISLADVALLAPGPGLAPPPQPPTSDLAGEPSDESEESTAAFKPEFGATTTGGAWSLTLELARYHRLCLPIGAIDARYFQGDTPPEFEPPTDVARHWYGVAQRIGEDEYETPVWRSAGWFRVGHGTDCEYEEAKIVARVPGAWSKGTTPSSAVDGNKRYALAREEWARRWMDESPAARGMSAELRRELAFGIVRNFDAAESTYRDLQQRPCDLPRWYWDRPSCPPYIPPLGIFKRTWTPDVLWDREREEHYVLVQTSQGWMPGETGAEFQAAGPVRHRTSAQGLDPETVREYQQDNYLHAKHEREWAECYRAAAAERAAGGTR